MRRTLLLIAAALFVTAVSGCGSSSAPLPENGKRFFGPQTPPTKRGAMLQQGAKQTPP
jgi:hypothetical protein